MCECVCCQLGQGNTVTIHHNTYPLFVLGCHYVVGPKFLIGSMQNQKRWRRRTVRGVVISDIAWDVT